MEPIVFFVIAAIPISLGSTICSLTVLVRIFVKGEVGVGCACFLPFVGSLILFFYGWSKAEEWEQQRLMMAWTVCIVLGIVYGAVFLILMASSGLLAAPR